MTPADLRIPTSKGKYKNSPSLKRKPRESGIKSELRERKETPNFLKIYSQGIQKSSPVQSIDNARDLNKQFKLMKKNKTIEDMLLNHSTGLNYKTNYPMEKVNSKLF